MAERSAMAGENRGDALLCFSDLPSALPGRTPGAAWAPDALVGTSRLLWGARSDGWQGFPVKELSAGPWRLWRVGESYGIAAPGEEDDRLLGVAEGRRPASDLNGHVLLLGWNTSERRWHVWTDRFGTVHAYLASNGSKTALGTFFPVVAAVASARRLDWAGLAGFFAFGFFPRDRTFFDDVRILRPATHVALDTTGRIVEEERYWKWRHEPDLGRSRESTVEGFAEVLHRVMDGETSGRIAIPISGGLDSRTTVAALTRPEATRGASRWSYSYGYAPDSIETRIAGEVARARGLSFESLAVGPYLFDRWKSVLACVEGFQDVTQARQAIVSDLLAGRADAVIAAHWGDVWLDDMGLVDEPNATEAKVVDHAFGKVAKRGRRWLLDEIVARNLGADVEALLHEQVADEIEPLRDIRDVDFRLKAYKTEQWSFRWTLASLRMYQAGAFPRLPFYDTRMTDYFATVPTAFVQGRRLQIDYLKRFAPDLARIDWQAYGTNLYRYRYFDSLLLPARALRKLGRMIGGRPAPQRNWEVQFLGAENRRRLEDALLARNGRLRNLVAESAVRSLLEDFYAAPFEQGRGYSVSMLLTFASWLETYG